MTPDVGHLFRGLDLTQQRSLIVAVSGGSDSLSLLFLVHHFLQAHAPATPLLAVTVDHGLRAEAAEEAVRVGLLCRSRGIAHRTMVWRGDKPKTGVSVAAREARYRLLAEAADAFGADCVLTGHTMDDQAETVAMRGERGAGPGLSGMAASTLFDGRVWIVRPLLDLRRQQLRDYLGAIGVDWTDDPSNENRASERVRMRSALADSRSVETLCAAARDAGRERRRLSDAAGQLVTLHGSMPSPGLFRLDRSVLSEDRRTVIHAVRAVLAMAGGAPYLPDVPRTEALVAQLSTGDTARVPLSRAVVDARRDALWIRREARNLPHDPVAAEPLVWDGRWRIAAKETRTLRVAPLGGQRAAERVGETTELPKSLLLAAFSQEPALFDDEEFIGLAGDARPGDRRVQACRVTGPFARFLPDFDLVLADALARMAGVDVAPSSPWKHHIGTGA